MRCRVWREEQGCREKKRKKEEEEEEREREGFNPKFQFILRARPKTLLRFSKTFSFNGKEQTSEPIEVSERRRVQAPTRPLPRDQNPRPPLLSWLHHLPLRLQRRRYRALHRRPMWLPSLLQSPTFRSFSLPQGSLSHFAQGAQGIRPPRDQTLLFLTLCDR